MAQEGWTIFSWPEQFYKLGCHSVGPSLEVCEKVTFRVLDDN